MMFELRDLGFSTAIGIGGDPVIGTTHIDAIEAFEKDPETKIIVMIGEIGGDAEERAADYIKANVSKPVVGYVAGFTAPEGKTMGHAGAIVSARRAPRRQEGGPGGRRRQGRQDPVGDRQAGPRDPQEPLYPQSAPVSGAGRFGTPRPSPARAAAGKRPLLVLEPGDRVTHDKYGLGRVEEVSGVGESAMSLIDFGSSGRVKLMHNHAPVAKL